MKPVVAALLAGLISGAALAAPKIEKITVNPSQPKFAGGKAPEVELAISISRTRFDSGNCDARVDFGDGEGRTVDFGVAAKRNVKHTYKKSGSFTVVAKGVGKTPCDGMQQMPVVVAGEPKPAAKKAPVKKTPAKKKDEKKKDDPK